jgi:tRNA U34 5-carboxymethylaminomethyl modifying enzyme MnmG/GidA
VIPTTVGRCGLDLQAGLPEVQTSVQLWSPLYVQAISARMRVQIRGVRTFFGITFRCRAAVVTTGTFMNGRIWVGRQSMPAGRCVAF